MTTPGNFRCTCGNGFVGDGKTCQQTETIVKWVDGSLGQKVPIVIPPPAKPALKLDKSDPARSFAAAKAAAVAAGAAGTPRVGSIAVDAAGKLIPAGAAGANPSTGISGAAPTNRFDLKSAVSDVLKVITNKLDDSDLAQSMTKQKRQEKSIRAVNGRLSKLERSTKDLIYTTQKQTETLKGMLGYQEFEASNKQTAVAANTTPSDASAAASPTAQADIAHLIRKAVKGQSYSDKDK